jgi:hypothetical protein
VTCVGFLKPCVDVACDVRPRRHTLLWCASATVEGDQERAYLNGDVVEIDMLRNPRPGIDLSEPGHSAMNKSLIRSKTKVAGVQYTLWRR